MIGFLAKDRLLLDQPVLLPKQSLIPGESPSQSDFRSPASYQLALITCDRAVFATFNNDIWRRIPPVRKLLNGHFLPSLFPYPGSYQDTRTDWNKLPSKQPIHIDTDQLCPIPDIDLVLGLSRRAASSFISVIKPTQHRSSIDVAGDETRAYSISFISRPDNLSERTRRPHIAVLYSRLKDQARRMLYLSILCRRAASYIDLLFIPSEVQ